MKRSSLTAGAASPGVTMQDDTGTRLLSFLLDGGDAPEVLWSAGLAHIERAVADAKEARHGRFRHYPIGQARHLREELERALRIVDLAVEIIEEERERDRDLADELHQRAVDAARARRREQTLPAELARLENQRRRRAGIPTENFHLRDDYPKEGTGR